MRFSPALPKSRSAPRSTAPLIVTMSLIGGFSGAGVPQLGARVENRVAPGGCAGP